MADRTTEFRVIIWIYMAIRALVPFAFMLTTINGEKLCIVIEGSRYPCIFSMTSGAIRRKLCAQVIRIFGIIIFCSMAAKTGIWGVVIIPVMAGGAVISYHGMRSIEHVKIIVYGEAGRHPIRCRRMTHGTIRG